MWRQPPLRQARGRLSAVSVERSSTLSAVTSASLRVDYLGEVSENT